MTALSAQDVLACSYGYRAGRGAFDAVRALTCDLPYGRAGYLGEADLTGCCAHLDHTWLLDRLRRRIDDRALLHLLRHWLQAGMVDTEGPGVHPEPGPPQGGTVSPGRANV